MSTRIGHIGIHGLLAALVCLTVACGDKGTSIKPSDSPPKPPSEVPGKRAPDPPAPSPEVKTFGTAHAALQYVLEKSDPLVVGFGEFHQRTGTTATLSALERFSEELLPVIAGRTSDLVVETWMSAGACGKAEKQVTRDVDQVSDRPEVTESETVRLIKKAAALGVQPHVLELKCDDYQKLQVDGGVDYLALLELVGKRLGEKAEQALLFRDAERTEKKTPPGKADALATKKMVAIYGGAVHNDAEPAEMWKSVTFGAELERFSSGRYVEVDLCVPEFVEAGDAGKEELWYAAFEKNASPDKTLVIQVGKNAYVIVFRKGVASR
jgi:hypothetical protein